MSTLAPVFASSAASPGSLLRKHLTPAVWETLKNVRTRSGVTLQDCICSGLSTDDSVIGVYAGDEESIEVFAPLFGPLIRELHPDFRDEGAHCLADGPAQVWLDNPDPAGAYILSTRIRLARNLRGYRLMPAIAHKELLQVEQQARETFAALQADLAGRYHSLAGLEPDGSADLVQALAPGFHGRDHFQRAAGITRAWPEGRGVFLNAERSLQVWVNEEDHLRLVSMAPGADLAAAYARLQRYHAALERLLPFQYSPRYGYLTACPSNLGTGLRASFRMRLPLARQCEEFQSVCDAHCLEVRSPLGERTTVQGAVPNAFCDISNRRRLGVTAVQCLEDLQQGAAKLIALEKDLEEG